MGGKRLFQTGIAYKQILSRAGSDELLSAEDTPPFLLSRFPGLRIGAGRAFSPVRQWHPAAQLPVYSDRIARDFHPIPYDPLYKGALRKSLLISFGL